MSSKDVKRSRRDVLKSSAGTLIGISTVSGTAIAGKAKKGGNWEAFERLVQSWEKRYGRLEGKSIIEDEKKNTVDILLVEFKFEDGTTKEVEYRWNSEEEILVATSGTKDFLTESPNELARSAPRIPPNSAPKGESDGVTTKAIGTDKDDATLPASTTINNPPVITPGSSKSGSSANSGQYWKNGFGVEEITQDEADFRGEAYSSGAIASATQAGVQVWYEFKVADESPITTPSVVVDFDYFWKAHTAVGGGSSELYIDAFFNEAYEGNVITSEIKTKSSDVGDLWTDSGYESASFQTEVRPGGLYRFGLHVDTTATAISTAVAKADVKDGDKEVDIGNFSISWT